MERQTVRRLCLISKLVVSGISLGCVCGGLVMAALHQGPRYLLLALAGAVDGLVGLCILGAIDLICDMHLKLSLRPVDPPPQLDASPE